MFPFHLVYIIIPATQEILKKQASQFSLPVYWENKIKHIIW